LILLGGKAMYFEKKPRERSQLRKKRDRGQRNFDKKKRRCSKRNEHTNIEVKNLQTLTCTITQTKTEIFPWRCSECNTVQIISERVSEYLFK
jgi:hypothetical protein